MINLILLRGTQEMIWIVALRKNVSVFGVILLHIFPAFSRIWTEYGEISPYSVSIFSPMQENAGKMRSRK